MKRKFGLVPKGITYLLSRRNVLFLRPLVKLFLFIFLEKNNEKRSLN